MHAVSGSEGILDAVQREERMPMLKVEINHLQVVDMLEVFSNGICCHVRPGRSNDQITSCTVASNTTSQAFADGRLSLIPSHRHLYEISHLVPFQYEADSYTHLLALDVDISLLRIQ